MTPIRLPTYTQRDPCRPARSLPPHRSWARMHSMPTIEFTIRAHATWYVRCGLVRFCDTCSRAYSFLYLHSAQLVLCHRWPVLRVLGRRWAGGRAWIPGAARPIVSNHAVRASRSVRLHRPYADLERSSSHHDPIILQQTPFNDNEICPSHVAPL